MIKIIILLAVLDGVTLTFEVPTMAECLATVEVVDTFENSRAECKELLFFANEA
jgi:hypothetical protein